MVPTEVNNVLTLLKEKEPKIHFGKYFLHSLVMGAEINVITINYPTPKSHCEAVGTLALEGYKLTHSELNYYHFQVNTYTLKLRVKKKIYITDFDYVSYCPTLQKLHISGCTFAVRERKLEVFKNKTCKLGFDPYVEVSVEKTWQEHQEGLLHYVNKGWKILDRDGDEVLFSIPGSVFDYLDPNIKWTARKKVTVPVKEELTHEKFLCEFDQLLTKYGMKASVISK